MMGFFEDAKNYFEMQTEDFIRWKENILLIFSKDDDIFSWKVKNSMVRMMPEPMVLTDVPGGHLTLAIKMKKYTELVQTFVCSKCMSSSYTQLDKKNMV